MCSLQGTLNNQTGIFPQSFVKIIKPLPDIDTEVEGEGHTYSCLRCFLLTPSGVDTRYVMCMCVRVHSKVFGQKWTSCHTDIINALHDCIFFSRDVCVQEDLTIQPTYKDLLSRMRLVFTVVTWVIPRNAAYRFIMFLNFRSAACKHFISETQS